MPEPIIPVPPPDGVTPPVDENAGLKKALDAERSARKELERTLKAREQSDTDAKAAHEKADMERKGEWEKLKLTVEAEKKARQDETAKATSGHKSYAMKTALLTAIGDNSPHLLKQIEDEFEVIFSPDGAPIVQSKIGGKTPAAYLETMKADPAWGHFFNASGASGGGANPPGKPSGNGFDKMTKTELTQALNDPATKAAATAFLSK